ncbi:efflux RND transporter permease subunit [Caulobacter segnis]|uniref:efflux RND transporter permease subunit n=1 Tax=Caulobacter segnis TaxID=88688 RepID=UPI001CBE28CF|nr:efflux RND transporter permease subunit [Caulobacter segnis]UAL12564.1 efflux RND transporter permease subunit [Caulobacter segnis]
MISLVRTALARPYTFVVMAAMILIVGVLAILRTPTDIFPNIRVPVVAVAWTYNGLSPSDMSGRILTPYQRALTTTVNDIDHIEATSLQGIGVVKIYFQPGADVRLANAQITAISQTLLRQLPPSTTPPLVLNYNASTVPIVQLALSGQGMSEQQLYDLGQNFIRTRLVTVPGAALPFPFGGKTRQIQVDIDPQALLSKGLSATDVGAAIAAQTQITPAGFVKIGEFQYALRLNNAPGSVDELNALPIKTVNGATIRIGDVAHVRDGSAPQQNVVHVDGQRSVLMTVLKSGATSTIAIVDGVKAALPELKAQLPPELSITPLNDQSTFVKAAVEGVVHEGALAAVLTSLMILLFLGSWRSTVIIAVSIPLAVLAAIAALSAFGQTLNVMTLGGLALAVGILVDDATVTIENINWHLEHGKDVKTAILDGAAQIVTPAFVSLLCICIVFVPMFFLPGVSGFLFVPMALSVVFAMVASFLLSRTLVPTMAAYLLKPHVPHDETAPSANRLVRFQREFERGFSKVRDAYSGLLGVALGARGVFVAGFLGFALLSLGLVPFLGRNFFPAVDSGSIAMHVRAPTGMRIEESAALFDRIQRQVRAIIPAGEVDTIVDNIGLSTSGINVAYNASGTIGPQDGDILISLKKGHKPTDGYVRALREELPKAFPNATFSFLPADVTSQILNFGSPAPIDIQVAGGDMAANQAYAQKILRAIRGVDGVADVRIQQPVASPELRFDADRTRIHALGLDERDVTASLAGAVAGSAQAAPVFWLNPTNGVSYPVVAQTPEYMLDSLDKLRAIPVSGARVPEQAPQVLGGLGDLRRGSTAAVVSQYNIQPMINVFAATQGRDLGGVAADIQKILEKLEKEKPAKVRVTLRGQYQTMNTAFSGMGWGLLGAVVMIYLLIVINFQSWLDPFVIISALPAALAGIAWMLFATGTPLSVPALTGAIMCMGVATANSILVVSFARERLEATGDAVQAAFEAGVTRFRPVLMTALAMIIGMAPMALALGEGAEQNAPLGRAVIGGLIFATCASLLFVPTIFSIVHGRRPHAKAASPEGATHA